MLMSASFAVPVAMPIVGSSGQGHCRYYNDVGSKPEQLERRAWKKHRAEHSLLACAMNK
jgi:hypothetical protein